MIKLSLIIYFLHFSLADLGSLDTRIKNSPLQRGLSVSVKNLTTGETYDWQESIRRRPASLMKIASLGAAVHHLKLDTKFKTKLRMNELKGALVGPLCIEGGGDPAFVSESMWVLVNHFTRKDIKNISGGILVDSSYLSAEKLDPGRDDSRVSRAYDAPVSAMSFNWNSVNIYIQPTQVGQRAKVILDPENEYIVLKNQIETVKGLQQNLKNSIQLEREVLKDGREQISLKGKIGIKNSEEVIYRNIENPALWTGYNLMAFLKARGIQVSGSIQEGVCNSSWSVVAEVESKDLPLIYRDMMKFSNNFVTEMLVKQLGKEVRSEGTFASGKRVLDTYLSNLKIKGYTLSSVSGLSQQNMFLASDFLIMLEDLYQNFFKAESLQSFPLAGIDGTLKSRMKGDNIWIRGKTGLLNNTVALAGYAQNQKSEVLAFSMIYNGSDIYPARDLIDQLALELVK